MLETIWCSVLGVTFFGLAFAYHAALWLVAKKRNLVAVRAALMAAKLWMGILLLTVVSLAYSWLATGLWQDLQAHPMWILLLALSVAGFVASRMLLGKAKFWSAWGASWLFLLTALLMVGFKLFPSLAAFSP